MTPKRESPASRLPSYWSPYAPINPPEEPRVYPTLQHSAFSILNPPGDPPDTPSEHPVEHQAERLVEERAGGPSESTSSNPPEDSHVSSQTHQQAVPQTSLQGGSEEISKAKRTLLQLRNHCVMNQQLLIAPRVLFRVQWAGCRTELNSSNSIEASRKDQDWGMPELQIAFAQLAEMSNISGQIYEEEGGRVGDDPTPTAREFLASRQTGRAGTPMPSAGASSAMPVLPPGVSSVTSISPASSSSALPASMPPARLSSPMSSFLASNVPNLPASSASNASEVAASPSGNIVSAASLSPTVSATPTRPTPHDDDDNDGDGDDDDDDADKTSPLIPVFTDEEHAKKWAMKMSMKTRENCTIYEISTLLFCKAGGALIPITEKFLNLFKIRVRNETIGSRLFGGWELEAYDVLTYACVGKVPSTTIIASFEWGVWVPEAHGLHRADSDEEMSDTETT